MTGYYCDVGGCEERSCSSVAIGDPQRVKLFVCRKHRDAVNAIFHQYELDFCDMRARHARESLHLLHKFKEDAISVPSKDAEK